MVLVGLENNTQKRAFESMSGGWGGSGAIAIRVAGESRDAGLRSQGRVGMVAGLGWGRGVGRGGAWCGVGVGSTGGLYWAKGAVGCS